MAKRKKNRNEQQNNGGTAMETEFGAELTQSKKERKKAARERKNNS
jgi:hypothetical protein